MRSRNYICGMLCSPARNECLRRPRRVSEGSRFHRPRDADSDLLRYLDKVRFGNGARRLPGERTALARFVEQRERAKRR